MNLELITYQAEDGLELDGAYYTGSEATRPADPLVIMTHGAWMNFYTGPQRFLPRFLVPAGFDCLAVNSRDRDLGYLHPPDGTCYGMLRCRFEDVLLDLYGALAWGRVKGYRRFTLVCHSYSGQRGAYFLSRKKESGIEALAMMSPPAGIRQNHRFWLDDWKHFARKALTLVQAGKPYEIVIERPSGRFPIIARAETILNLWLDGNAIKQCAFMEGLTIPLLHTLGEKESSLDPIRTKGNWIAGVWAGPVTRAVIAGYGHFYLENPQGLADKVLEWLESIAPRS
jgi:pimeloyl-ACP methyl ester carboxylesterase